VDGRGPWRAAPAARRRQGNGALGLSANHLDHGSRSGFPSTHAAVMSTAVGFMAVAIPVWSLIAAMATVTLCTSWARVHAGAHFPSDVLAGLVGGAALGALVALQLI
jgi:undecaprenyl-diphosphatase